MAEVWSKLLSTILALDMSVWGGVFTLQEAQEAVHLGYKLTIVGGWHGGTKNQYARESLANARTAGMMIATYTILNSIPGAFAVDRCREACGDMWDHLKFVALDCEVDGITKATIRDAEVHALALGHQPIIYTGRWWWVGHFGNPQDFKHLPLWHSYYDLDPDIDFGRMQYGGWTMADLIGEQFQGTTIVAGQSVDKNVFIAEKLGQVAEEEEEDDDMRPLLITVAGTQVSWITDLVWRSPIRSTELFAQLRYAGARTDPNGRAFRIEPEFLERIPIAMHVNEEGQ